ncbi:MAG: hypothetical protein Q8K75_11970 [Chlamydiales bacterium]|nr:hypothetical protein [Chlamydiales bacterium]
MIGYIASKMPSPLRVALGGPSNKEIQAVRERVAMLESVEAIARNTTLTAIAVAVISLGVGMCFSGGLRGILRLAALPAAIFEDIIRVVIRVINYQSLPASITGRSIEYLINAASTQPFLTMDIAFASMMFGSITSTVTTCVNHFKHQAIERITRRNWGQEI